MKSNLKIRKNIFSNKELSVVILLYLLPISYVTAVIIPKSYLFYSEKILFILFFILILSFNKLKFTFKSIFLILITITLFLVNALFSEYPTYVLAILFNFIVIFIPVVYLINVELDYKKIFAYWHKFSIIFTLLLPIFINLYFLKKIGYYEVGLVTHINTISLAFSISQSNKKTNIICLIANILICLFFGSRSVFVSSVILTFFVYLLFKRKRNFSFYFIISIVSGMGIYIYANLIDILYSIQNLMIRFGINSRNLSLFIQQLSAQNTDIYLSGRDGIYPVIIEQLKMANGLPEGVGVARILTHNMFYHSHNFFLEMLLTFGTILGSILIIALLFMIIFHLLKNIQSYQIYFGIALLISFLLRSLVGTYFLQDVIFILGVCSLINYTFRTKK